MYPPCKLCKNSDQGRFVEDCRTADIICTCCGCVQRWINNSHGNTTYSEPIAIVQPTSAQKKFLRINDQMMNKVCPEEYKEGKRNKIIKEYCEQLDLVESIQTRTKLLLKKNYEKLRQIRPQNNLIASCIIIACQSVRRYINIGDMEQFLGLTNVNSTLKTVCKIIGINQRSIILNSVPYLISTVGLPFKFEKKLSDLYKTVCRKNPSMGAETRMALCFYKLYTENIDKARYKNADLEFVAQLTNTSENSLKTYISGKTKNCLYQESKRKRKKEENVDNKKSKIA